MKSSLMHLLPTALTIPPQPIHTPLWPFLLQHNPHCVFEPYRVMWRVGGQQEHIALMYMYVAELAGVYDLEQHGAFVLVKPLGSAINVVVGALVRASDDHDGEGGVINAVVVYGGLEHVGVL
jgi:hypothetical protein